MSSRRSSFINERPPDLSMVDRRLSMLDIEEQDVETPVDANLSKVSTLALNQKQDANAKDSSPTAEDSSGWSTPNSTTSSPSTPVPGQLVRSDSHVMQIKKETYTRSSRCRKGSKTITKFFYEEIDDHWTAALIVVCFFVSGIVDSVSYQVFSVFTSLQTGNTIFMALRLSNQPASRHPFAYIKSITSVASYCLGGLMFNILHRAPTDFSSTKPRLHRWTLFTSFFVQSALLIISAALAQSGWVSTQPFRSGTFSSGSSRNPEGDENFLDLIPIAFLAFESAGQVCLSRVLVVNELPTIVISTLYHDFIADALGWRKLWKTRKSNWDFIEGQKRQIRRILSIFALFAGAIVGGFVYASPGSIAAALWIAAGAKSMICLVWCLWRKKVVTETVVTHEGEKPS